MSFLSALIPARLRAPTRPEVAPVETGLRIVESVAGNWSYHLAHGPQRKALCNPKLVMMQTGIPLSAWGYKSDHLPERYCAQCASIAARDSLGVLG